MSLPQWKGLFDWSMKYQDGTQPADWNPQDYDPEKMKWLERVLKHYMQDFAARMKQIKEALDTNTAPPPGPAEADETPAAQEQTEKASAPLTLQDKERLLDELMDIVSSIDFARDLHKIGGLSTLLELLTCQEPSLQWRAAEVVATCVANNPPVQQWFLEGGVLPRLLQLLDAEGCEEAQVMLRVKGLLALSGLVRHSAPALSALCAAGGVARVARLGGDRDRRVQRKAFSLLQYMTSQMPSQSGAIAQAGAASAASQVIESAVGTSPQGGLSVDGSDLRQSALELLSQLASEQSGWAAVSSVPGLVPSLSSLQGSLSALPPEDRETCEDEAAAARSLLSLLQGPAPAAAPLEAAHDSHISPSQYQQQHEAESVTVNVNTHPSQLQLGVVGVEPF